MVKRTVGDLSLTSTTTAFSSIVLGRLVSTMPRASIHSFTDTCPVSVFRLKASDTPYAYVEPLLQKRL